jgi:hypothetical protein
MKKINLILAGAFCLTALGLQAQDGPKKDTTLLQQSQNYREDMVKITSDDIPAAVRSTLQSSQYKGWETANIFKNGPGDVYVVEIEGDDRQVKVYKFDANGRPIKDN